MFAHILARAVDATDFRPSRSGGATVPVPAHRLRECRRAISRRGRRFADFRDSVYSHFDSRCMHSRMQLSSLHLNEDADNPGFFSKHGFHGQFGRLTCECRARATRSAYTHPIGHAHLVQRISTLGIEGRGDHWSGDSGHGTTNERRCHLTGIRELARVSAMSSELPPHLEIRV